MVFHLKHADNFLLTNLSTGAIGIVPRGQRARVLAASGGHGAVSLREPADRSGCGDRAQPAELVRCRRRSSGCALPWFPTPLPSRWNWKKAQATWPSIPCPWILCRCSPQRPNLQVEDDRRNADSVPRLQPARSAAERCAGAPGDCLRHRPQAHHPDAAGRPCAARAEPAARQVTGPGPATWRATTTIRRGRNGCWMKPAIARGGDGSPLSPDDEDQQRRGYARCWPRCCSSNWPRWALRSTCAATSSPHFTPT